MFLGDILLYIVIGVIVMHRKNIVFLILFSVVCPISVPISFNSELNINLIFKE